MIAYHDGYIKRKCLKIFRKEDPYKELYFKGKHWLKVKKAKDPSIILWENLSKSNTAKYIRYGFSIFLSLALTAVTMTVLLSLSYYENVLEKGSA